MQYVHDWAGLFEDCIYADVEGVNTAREFVLRQWEDGGVCMHLPRYSELCIFDNPPACVLAIAVQRCVLCVLLAHSCCILV